MVIGQEADEGGICLKVEVGGGGKVVVGGWAVNP